VTVSFGGGWTQAMAMKHIEIMNVDFMVRQLLND
jgi:hypothetical protein